MIDICVPSETPLFLLKFLIISRPSILLVANSSWNLFHYRRPWIEGLVEAGYSVLTAAPIDQHLHRLEKLTHSKHFPLRAMDPKGQRSLQEIDCLREIRALYRQLNPSLVVHFTVKPNIYGGLAARSLDLPYLAVITGLGYPFLHGGWRNRIVPQLYKIALKRAQQVVFYNQTDADHFLAHQLAAPSQLALINGSGVNSEYFAHVPVPRRNDGPLRMIYVGRILRDKGIMELLEATQLALLAGVNVQLTILGDLHALNPEVMERKDFLDFIEAINLASSTVFSTSLPYPRVQFIDAVDDVRPWLAAHQLFVLPSYREGLSRAGVEALATGRPILTTDVPGCRELVLKKDANGKLVPAKDIAALKNAIAYFAELNDAALVQMGLRSRQLAEKQFSAAATTAAFLQLVQESTT